MISALLEELKLISNLDQIIYSPKLFFEALDEFEKIIELDDVKQIIILQTRLFLSRLLRKEDTLITKDFFNAVFYGPPGVGKSRTAKILAKLWKGLGVLHQPLHSKSNGREISLSSEDASKLKEYFLELFDNHFSKNKRSAVLDEKWHSIKTMLDGITSPSRESENSAIVCGREDFVANYSGQTCEKSLAFLKKNAGKCIILEEAYLLCHSDSDNYGLEALTVINRWMDEQRGSNIFIFTGYKELMHSTIFSRQPGLLRRFRWFFDVRGYSAEGLSKIFTEQLHSKFVSLSEEIDLIAFFEKEKDKFPNFGGDTDRFSGECILFHSCLLSVESSEKEIITPEEFDAAFKSFVSHSA